MVVSYLEGEGPGTLASQKLPPTPIEQHPQKSLDELGHDNSVLQLLDGESRHRDIFPLPLIAEPGPAQRKLSKSTFGRLRKVQSWTSWANRGILSLNSLAGYGSSKVAPRVMSACQESCLDHIKACYKDVGCSDAFDVSGKEALGALLASSSTYSDTPSVTRPYQKELVSWPSEGNKPVPLSTCLTQADNEWFGRWRETLLRDPSEQKLVQHELELEKPYCEPSLTKNPHTYSDFYGHYIIGA